MTPDRTKAPATSPVADIHLAPERIERLGNGIDLHIVDAGDQPLSRLTLFSEGGTLDYPSQPTVAVASEAMRELTAGMDGEQIADTVDFNGARLGTRQGEHYTGIDLVALNSRMPDVLPVVGQIVTEARFTPHTVRMTASKAASARAVQLTRVSVIASEAAHAAVQGADHPASRTPMPDDFTAVTPDGCAAWYGQFASAARHAFIGGRLDEATLRSVRAFLESLPAAEARPVDIVPYSPGAPGREDIAVEGAVQAAVAMTLPAIGREHPDYIPLRLTVMALGGYFGSRLMGNIREEKGLTYGINAALLGNREGAYMEINAQCDARYTDRVIAETMHEIDALRTRPPRGAELDRLRLFAWTSLASAADSAIGAIDHYITRMLVGTPADYFDRQLEAIRTLSPEIIAEMACRYLDKDRIFTVTAGPAI